MTEPDAYGVYRVYSTQPTYDPHDLFGLEDTCEALTLTATADNSSRWWTGFGSALAMIEEFFAPFLNATVFHLMKWFYNGNDRKSLSNLDSLVQDVIQAPDFCSEDLATFRVTRKAHDDTTPEYTIGGMFYCKLLEFWQPSSDSPPERLYGELYTADAMIAEQKKLESQCSEPDDIEPVIAAIMLYSDSTHLANFGTASLWPMYAFIGNQSKYISAKPTSFVAHHLAYIPKLPDTIQEFYQAVYNTVTSVATLVHCKCELMQVIIALLLDEEFMHAYEYGILMEFADGIMH
ncbi:uncharacterized protein LAESUDRAFT_760025 [Laetiporus sulphureus 93-53]|uniref:Uncharacterized protein n=1 Tax=Laetiporus sulphureus 93-53 TaxID=1314785 RepID=A0A165DX06_9APHY|nr:uncharacterized protein LAESUDRAFT_760025 [Laetiporus sulphureus 93-53]KZT05800.1 hypothetical protein LAESUDRAFT_760025 [Laetiporus sulphureus 93-53]